MGIILKPPLHVESWNSTDPQTLRYCRGTRIWVYYLYAFVQCSVTELREGSWKQTKDRLGKCYNKGISLWSGINVGFCSNYSVGMRGHRMELRQQYSMFGWTRVRR